MTSRYTVTVPTANRQNITTTFKTQVLLTAQTAGSGIRLGRFNIYDIMFGPAAVPNSTDCEIEWDVAVSTGTAGTSTSYTPNKLDPADAAASTLAGVGHTAEPGTLGASVLNIGLNQRASFRWAAVPGSEIVAPATNLNGFALRALSSNNAVKQACTVAFSE